MLNENIPGAQGLQPLANRFLVQADQILEFAERDRHGAGAPTPCLLNDRKREAPFRPAQSGSDQMAQGIVSDFDGGATFHLLRHVHTYSLSRTERACERNQVPWE